MSFFRKTLYDTINTSMIRAMFSLVSDFDNAYKYGETDEELDGDLAPANQLNSWPKTSGDITFLDPDKYGGNIANPAFYIKPPIKNGWQGFVDALVPDINMCAGTPSEESTSDNTSGCAGIDTDGTTETESTESPPQDFLGIDNIAKRARDSYTRIDDDPRIYLDQDCDIETPFAKIHTRESAVTMEALIYTLCRIYMNEFMLKSMIAFARVKPSFENNLDDILFEYIVQNMKTELTELSTSIGRRKLFFTGNDNPVPINWNIFLEQSVQLFVRLYGHGKIEPSDEELEALDTCQIAQNSFEFPTDEEIMDEVKVLRRMLLTGASLTKLAQYGIVFGGPLLLLFPRLLKKKARKKLILQRKMDTIEAVEDSCLVLVRYFLKQESNYVADGLFESLSNNENFSGYLIENLHRYFIEQSDSFWRRSDGQVADVPQIDSNDILVNVFDTNNISCSYNDKKTTNGGFVLEKYIRVQPKSEILDSLPTSLKGVVNIDSFTSADWASYDLENGSNISDYFGDLEITQDDDGQDVLDGNSNGISYGLRISYVLPLDETYKEFEDIFATEFKQFQLSSFSKMMSALQMGEPTTFSDHSTSASNTKYLFPIVSAEIDMLDMTIEDMNKLSSSDFTNNDRGYYECLINKLLNSDEYKLMFRQLLPLQRHFSIVTIFVSASFLNSLESDIIDRDDYVNTVGGFFSHTIEDWDKDVLAKTKKGIIRKFKREYNSLDEDHEEPDEEESSKSSKRIKRKNFKFGINLNLGLKWWLRRRQRFDVCPEDLGE